MSSIFTLFTSFLHALVTVLMSLGTPQPHAPLRQIPTSPPPLVQTISTTTTARSTVSLSNKPATTPIMPKAAVLPAKVHISPTQTPIPNVTPPPAPQTTQATSPTQSRTTDEFNTTLRESLVNIVCTTGPGGYFNPITGSGVIVDTRGIVLTNAHVAQFLLLKDFPTQGNVQCVVRTGSPASARYRATPFYLPPAWIDAHSDQIKNPNATETGEDDYAFLLITETINGDPLPSSFTATTLTLSEPSKGDAVLVGAYPAQYLGGTTIQTNLYASTALTTVSDVYTFASTTIDVLSLANSILSQKGSSGGAVINTTTGALAGLIVTESSGSTTASRTLQAITLSHINRSLNTHGKGSILGLFTGDVAVKAADFMTNTAPLLTKKLTSVFK